MTILEQENNIACNCDSAWGVLADFGNFLAWATGGSGIARLEGEGVGMIRHLDIPGLGQVSERLDQLDHDSRTLAYTMVSEGMIGISRYSATVEVVGDGVDRCTLKWHGEFETQADTDAEEVNKSLAGSYAMMAQGLEAFVNAHQ